MSSLEEARLLLREHQADSHTLYQRWFHRQTGETLAWPSAGAYRAAMLDGARFENGWRVVRPAPGLAGAVVAMRGGRERLVAPPEMAPQNPHDLAPGKGAALRVDPLAAGEAGGFWHVWSAGWQKQAPADFYRVYCRLSPACALAFVRRVAQAAPPGVVWAMKALCGEHESGRRDGALLYLPLDVPLTTSWLADLLPAIAPDCVGELPPFVQPLAPGIGHAPDPGGGRSFGQAVCDAIVSSAPLADDPLRFAATALEAIEALGLKNRRQHPPTEARETSG